MGVMGVVGNMAIAIPRAEASFVLTGGGYCGILDGPLLPNVVAIANQPRWSSQARGLVTFTICLVIGFIVTALTARRRMGANQHRDGHRRGAARQSSQVRPPVEAERDRAQH